MSKYQDLNLDLDANSFTNDISTVSDNRSISQSLTNILLSRVGERPFSSSNTGVGLESLFFTLTSPRSVEFLDLKQTAKEKINRYEPRVVFDDMTIENVDTMQDDGVIKVNVSYTIKGTNKIDNLPLVIRGNYNV